MLRRSEILPGILFLALVGTSPAMAQTSQAPKKDKNNVAGIVWAYELRKVVDNKPVGDEVKGRFRINEEEIFRDGKKVGSIRPDGKTDSDLKFSDWPEMNGSARMKKIGKDPATWQGTLNKKDGTKWKLVMRYHHT